SMRPWMTGLRSVRGGSGQRPVATRTCSRTARRRVCQVLREAGGLKKKALSLRLRTALSRRSAGFLPAAERGGGGGGGRGGGGGKGGGRAGRYRGGVLGAVGMGACGEGMYAAGERQRGGRGIVWGSSRSGVAVFVERGREGAHRAAEFEVPVRPD